MLHGEDVDRVLNARTVANHLVKSKVDARAQRHQVLRKPEGSSF